MVAIQQFNGIIPRRCVVAFGMKTLALLLICLSLVCLAFAQEPAPKPAARNPPKLVEPAEAQKLITDKQVVILDVRSAAEFASGHLHGATNLDIRDPEFKTKLAKLDKSKAYLVHCAVGMRSARACETMGQLDFATLYDLKGGLTAWQKAGLPVEK